MRKEFYVYGTDELVDLAKESFPLLENWQLWSEMKYHEAVTYHEIYSRKDYFRGDCIIKPGDVVIDIGSNTGIFSSVAFDMGAYRVLAYEPHPTMSEIAKKNNPMAENYQMAVSNNIGEIELYESKSSRGGNSIVENVRIISPEEYISKNIIVKTITLDEIIKTRFLDKIDFIKIDCEGAEVDVLKGLSDENLKKVKNIAVEYHHVAFNHDEDFYQNWIKRFLTNGFNVWTDVLDDNFRMTYISKGDISKK